MKLTKNHYIEGKIYKKGTYYKLVESYNYDRKYDYFNKLYFNNELPKIDFLNVNNKGNKYIGYAIGSNYDPESITINDYYFNDNNERQQDSVFVHEMIHIWIMAIGKHNPSNKHRGEFHKKAKDIEKISDLTLTGTTVKHVSSDYDTSNQPEVYVVFYQDKGRDEGKLLKNSIEDIKFYSIDTSISDIKNDENISVRSRVGYLYSIKTNSPIVDYKQIEKLLNKQIDANRKFTDMVYRNVKNNKKEVEFIKRFETVLYDDDAYKKALMKSIRR